MAVAAVGRSDSTYKHCLLSCLGDDTFIRTRDGPYGFPRQHGIAHCPSNVHLHSDVRQLPRKYFLL